MQLFIKSKFIYWSMSDIVRYTDELEGYPILSDINCYTQDCAKKSYINNSSKFNFPEHIGYLFLCVF